MTCNIIHLLSSTLFLYPSTYPQRNAVPIATAMTAFQDAPFVERSIDSLLHLEAPRTDFCEPLGYIQLVSFCEDTDQQSLVKKVLRLPAALYSELYGVAYR